MVGRRSRRPQFPPREPVLSEAAVAYAKKIESNRRLAIAFLKDAGIIDALAACPSAIDLVESTYTDEDTVIIQNLGPPWLSPYLLPLHQRPYANASQPEAQIYNEY
jgi:hypothetical protein